MKRKQTTNTKGETKMEKTNGKTEKREMPMNSETCEVCKNRPPIYTMYYQGLPIHICSVCDDSYTGGNTADMQTAYNRLKTLYGKG